VISDRQGQYSINPEQTVEELSVEGAGSDLLFEKNKVKSHRSREIRNSKGDKKGVKHHIIIVHTH
jgi:hypothetical protein